MRADVVRLYLVTDPSWGLPERVVVPAVEGGVTCVQARDKGASARALATTVGRLRAALAGSGVPVLSNDHAAGGDGVHVGRRDGPPTAWRAALGPDDLLGWSVEDLAQLEDTAAVEASSYVAVSPVHATPTKTDTARPLGLDGVRRAASALGGRTPLVAIGGMDLSTAGPAVRAGADGVAVVRAVGDAADPRRVATALREVVDEAVAGR